MKAKIILIYVAALLVAACVSSADIDGLQGQIDELKSERIATIDQQIAGINASLSQLEAIDKALKDYISALQGAAGELQAKDDSLERKIAELRIFVNGELKNAKDWEDEERAASAMRENPDLQRTGVCMLFIRHLLEFRKKSSRPACYPSTVNYIMIYF